MKNKKKCFFCLCLFFASILTLPLWAETKSISTSNIIEYDGKNHNLTNTNVLYRWKEDEEWKRGIPQGRNSGKYEIFIKGETRNGSKKNNLYL